MEKLKIIEWSNQFSIGNEDIDNDHKSLIAIYNDLITQIRENSSAESFALSLSKMTDYSLSHFKREEKFMKLMKYPELGYHTAQHNNFILKVANYNAELTSCFPPMREEVANYLQKWWINHIQKIDLKYINFKNTQKINIPYPEKDTL